jgi:hypothetical protein
MVTRAWICALMLASGCDRWRGAEPIWTLEASRIGVPELKAPLVAGAGEHGDTFVVLSEAHLGGRDFPGATIVRVDTSGAIREAVSVDAGARSPITVAADSQGRVVAVWDNTNSAYIAAFDEAMTLRWDLVVTVAGRPLYYSGFAVGSDGSLAYIRMDSNGAIIVHSISNDGIPRWQVDVGFVSRIAVAETGDVLAYVSGRRVRLAAADGAVVEDVPHDQPDTVAPDGAAVTSNNVAYVTYYEPSAAVRWRHLVQGIGSCPFGGCGVSPSEHGSTLLLEPAGDVLALTFQTDVVRLDGGTGEQVGATAHCDEIAVADAAADGYIVIGPTCDVPLALAKYPLPD